MDLDLLVSYNHSVVRIDVIDHVVDSLIGESIRLLLRNLVPTSFVC